MNQMPYIDLYYYYKNNLQQLLSDDRFTHSQRVVQTSLQLAKMFDVDEDKAALAAMVHDRGKEIRRDNLVEIAERAGIIIDEAEQYYPGLLHGPVGAQLLWEEGLIMDDDILSSVRYHTTARPAMSYLEMIVFLADLIEPERSYPKVDLLRRFCFKDPFYALFKSLDWTLEFLIREQRVIHPMTVKARNYYLRYYS